MGLKKLLKKAKKVIKKAVNLNPLIPGSKAQKQLSSAAKQAIPVVASIGGAPAINAATSSALNFLPDSLTQPGGTFDFLADALKKARDVAQIFQGEQPSAAVPVAQPPQTAPGISPTLLLGAVAVVGVVLIARKG